MLDTLDTSKLCRDPYIKDTIRQLFIYFPYFFRRFCIYLAPSGARYCEKIIGSLQKMGEGWSANPF